MYRRNATDECIEVLADTPILTIQGARQVGKSTLARSVLALSGTPLISLDDAGYRNAAVQDPDGFLRELPSPVGIDEIQHAPGLILAVKAAVDRDRSPGKFLLTGSSDFLRTPGIQDSLAGRAHTVELFGLSQGERLGRVENFIDRAFQEGPPGTITSELTRQSYVELACAGGYPEALMRSGNSRDRWFRSYVERVLSQDARIHSPRGRDVAERSALLLRVLAARNGSEANLAVIANDLGTPASRMASNLAILEALYLVDNVPAWSRNLSERVVRKPKLYVRDSGLAAQLINLEPDGTALGKNPDAAGPLIEGFVVGEINKQRTWSQTRPSIFHFRDRNGLEVDLILESRDGRIVAIEIKAGASPNSSDFKAMAWLRDKLGDRFRAGILLNSGADSVPFGDRLWALPIEALWSL